jgi:hypothetical protein
MRQALRPAITTFLVLLLLVGLGAIALGLGLAGHPQPDNPWEELGKAIGYGIAIIGGLVSFLAGVALWARRDAPIRQESDITVTRCICGLRVVVEKGGETACEGCGRQITAQEGGRSG